MNEYGRSRVLPSIVGRDLSKVAVLLVVAVVWGCGRSGPSGAPSAENATQPSQPALPAPSFSAAQKIGLFVYPKDNQTKDEQLRDELDCYNQVQQQTGINPETPPPAAPSSSQVQAAQQQAAEQAPQAQGRRARSGEGCGWRSHDRRDCWRRGQRSCSRGGGRDNARRQAAAPGERGVKAARGTIGVLRDAAAIPTGAGCIQRAAGHLQTGFSACMDSRSYSVK